MKEHNTRVIKQEVVKFIQDQAPNGVLREHIYSHLEKLPVAELDAIIDQLIHEKTLTDNLSETNRNKVFASKVVRSPIYLKEYASTTPVLEYLNLEHIMIPRMLDGDTARAEDINQVILSLKKYQDKLQWIVQEKVASEVAVVYRNLIAIFGVFVSVFAIIVIATDKMLRFDPGVIASVSYGELLARSFVLFVPVGLIIALLVALVIRKTS